MRVVEPATTAGASEPATRASSRPLRKRLMHAVRRAHLYFGLFLLPWTVLYGVTGFLFNHPAAFADAPTATFGRAELAGTPMESPPAPDAVAARVVAALNRRAGEGKTYSLVEPEKARYTREFAFATARADGHEVSVLFDVTGAGGTVRSRPVAPARPVEGAPFALGTPRSAPAADALRLDDPLHERVRSSVPVVLDRTGFPAGEVTVTSVPDLSFLMSDGERVWRVTYNALTGTVGGVPAEAATPGEELSARRFLTRLHLAHGFPGSPNARWFWAVVVDAMSAAMVFWALSGLFMWWQVKAARKAGFVVLVLSAAAAVTLGCGMHALLAP